MINWADIKTVFLDMDGTLLDLHFDNFFWLEHLPRRYAEEKKVPPQQARDQLMAMINREQGSLNWYCIDYWSESLDLDVRKLKEEIQHLVAFRPHVETFLDLLKKTDHRVVLVTNAHHKSLNLKLAITRLDHYVDNIVCSHDLGLPKEDPQFWDRLQEIEPFDKNATVFIDDSFAVLRSAEVYGIKHLYSIQQPDMKKPAREACDEFSMIESFQQLLPVEKTSE